MTYLRYTLVAEGASDRALLPILNWLIDREDVAYQPQLAEACYLPPPREGLLQRVRRALHLYPCELLFVHRDGDAVGWCVRVDEIRRELAALPHRYTPIVPVRMTEAWLLSSEAAIRQAAGNPNGRHALDLPGWRQWEDLRNPKEVLLGALRAASGRNLRQLRGFREHALRQRVAELTESFEPLARLPAFSRLQDDLSEIVRDWKARQLTAAGRSAGG